ncbi:MAG: CoA-binding protein, partial [Candidatus Marinimicrobia bacterium]|nr:CoA-binding protein [Candidatus Neomarinimicrobiota bacterium]
EGVFTLTTPEGTEEVVQQAIDAGVPRVWMHRSFGNSVSEKAVQMCRENGITVIPGACPMMFAEPVDFGHKCIKWFMGVTGKLPK